MEDDEEKKVKMPKKRRKMVQDQDEVEAAQSKRVECHHITKMLFSHFKLNLKSVTMDFFSLQILMEKMVFIVVEISLRSC